MQFVGLYAWSGCVSNVWGMRPYALLQRWFFWAGVAGFVLMLVILAFSSPCGFRRKIQ